MLLSESKILIGDDSILARKQLLFFLFLFVMPVKDGVTATREIMAQHPSAVIIIASSIGTKEQLKSAIEAGARDFIQKPFSAHNIQRIVEARFDH